MSKTLNQVCIPKGKVLNGVVNLTSMEKALEMSSVKYNTTLQVDEDSLFIAPQVVTDAVAMANCTIVDSCELPSVLGARQYTFDAGCQICMTNLTANERKAFGISLAKPRPTQEFIDYYEKSYTNNILNSTRKINWIGDKSYTSANITNPVLLENYKKQNGIWTDLVTIGAPHYTGEVAVKNALATKTAQLEWTGSEVLKVIDGMLLLQSPTMGMIVDSEKYVWVTSAMYQALVNDMKNKSFDLCCVGTMESQENGGQRVETIKYGDLTIVKYEELTQAIQDLANPLAPNAWNLPNRAVLALGLPNVNYVEQGEFATDYDEVTSMFKASYTLTPALVDSYPPDFYVIAY